MSLPDARVFLTLSSTLYLLHVHTLGIHVCIISESLTIIDALIVIPCLIAACRYFNVIGGSKDLNAVEMESQRGEYVLAHNGWVMNADPLINFAGEGSQVKISYCTCV